MTACSEFCVEFSFTISPLGLSQRGSACEVRRSERAPINLLEPRLFSGGGDFAGHRGVECGPGRLSARAGPQALLPHRNDQLTRSHRLSGFRKHLRCCVKRAESFVLGALSLHCSRLAGLRCLGDPVAALASLFRGFLLRRRLSFGGLGFASLCLGRLWWPSLCLLLRLRFTCHFESPFAGSDREHTSSLDLSRFSLVEHWHASGGSQVRSGEIVSHSDTYSE